MKYSLIASKDKITKQTITFFFVDYQKTTKDKNLVKNVIRELVKTKIFKKKCEITLLKTGLKTLTGGRLKRVVSHLNKNEDFMFTYGDGVSNVNLKKLIKFHKKHNRLVTVTAVRPPARFGELKIKKGLVETFKEKPQVASGWINGGFFVFNKKIFKYIKNDKTVLEQKPLESLSKSKNLIAFKHKKFWQCMDTRRDQELLEKLWKKKELLWLKS